MQFLEPDMIMCIILCSSLVFDTCVVTQDYYRQTNLLHRQCVTLEYHVLTAGT